MKTFKKSLKNDYKKIKKAYISQKGTDCFLDNFSVIRKYYRSAIASESDVDLTGCVSLCKKMCTDGDLPSTEGITAFFEEKSIPLTELMHLPDCIFAALLSCVSDRLSLGDTPDTAVKSILRLPDTDFERIISVLSEADKILSKDPANVYSSMSVRTKNIYRKALCKAAAERRENDIQIASEALSEAEQTGKHIGFFLGLNDEKSPMPFFFLELLLPTAVTSYVCKKLGNFKLFGLLLLPVCEITRTFSDKIILETGKAEKLPELKFSGSIPENAKAVITVSTVIPEKNKIQALKSHLKNLYLANKDENAPICILADPKNASLPILQDDSEKIGLLKNAVTELKNETGGSFILAVRSRQYSCVQNEYAAPERKRGAIDALVKYIKTGENSFREIFGDIDEMKNAKYLMLLDIDTSMPKGSLRRLIQIAEHPLNKPVFDKSTKTVTSGYGIIMPKTKTSVSSFMQTKFSSVMADSCGIAAYAPEEKEKNMLLCGTSSFSGKGLVSIEAFSELLSGRFPENYVLSHDILEGEILRTAFAGDVELTDSFPPNANAYFKRLHRWVRGDTQNLRFAFFNSLGLNYVSRLRIIENFRRCITPCVAAALMLSNRRFSKKYKRVITSICLLSFSSAELFSLIFAFLKNPKNNGFRLFFAPVYSYCTASLLKALFKTVYALRTAYTCGDAVCKSLYRMLFSKKKLLEWVTAADCTGGTIKAEFKRSIPSQIGAFLLFKSPDFLSRAAAYLFSAELPLTLAGKIKKNSALPSPTQEEICKITLRCSEMWKFFTDFNTPEYNFLIPDNITDDLSVDERTSPTNIGLMLCVFLSARDFGFITTDALFERLENSFKTIEKMKKYNGNLYNWYDIKTLEAIEPHFVSSVDSGNFMCCITALKEGLKEYLDENADLQKIIDKCERLIAECDFAFFYNKNRNLISVGFDTEKCELSPCHYDLLMSESRMMSYFAVAKNKVPLAHWSALSRQRASCGFYSAAAAWSGTMFEYFMPAIFLPSPVGSLSYEALNYAIYCQKKFAEKHSLPYGVSESAYNAVDRDGNYQYKAHGVTGAGLRPDLLSEYVISPYSTFLTLQLDPKNASINLDELKKYDMHGRYGFYESCDFEENRNELTLYSPVKTYMSHHIGMSFSASANCVFDGIWQKRFMSDSDMQGASALLFEKYDGDTDK